MDLKKLGYVECRGDIETLLADRRPWGPCRYGGPHRSLTLWSMIGCPKTKELYISEGPPDCSDYACFRPCN